jgi:ABC-type multidrug transport system ATPase subunit
VIELEHVSHSYPHVTSLDDVSMRVASGETVALIGPSGCGKSTLLKAVIGLVVPGRGRAICGASRDGSRRVSTSSPSWCSSDAKSCSGFRRTCRVGKASAWG